jgi:hypothetical protein
MNKPKVNFSTLICSFVALFAMSICSKVIASDVTFEEIDWIEHGSEEDNMQTLSAKSKMDDKAKRFNEVLKSERIIKEFDGRNIRIPGFIVPLTSNNEREVVEFFIVPYFGACLHLPPPPLTKLFLASGQMA